MKLRSLPYIIKYSAHSIVSAACGTTSPVSAATGTTLGALRNTSTRSLVSAAAGTTLGTLRNTSTRSLVSAAAGTTVGTLKNTSTRSLVSAAAGTTLGTLRNNSNRSLVSAAAGTTLGTLRNNSNRSLVSAAAGTTLGTLKNTSTRMPYCVASGCTNSSAKGYYLTKFPTDSELCNVWEKNVNRSGWKPSKHSVLCEVHFTLNQWEYHHSGKRKLRRNAIPTEFGRNLDSSLKENLSENSLKLLSIPINNRKKRHILCTNIGVFAKKRRPLQEMTNTSSVDSTEAFICTSVSGEASAVNLNATPETMTVISNYYNQSDATRKVVANENIIGSFHDRDVSYTNNTSWDRNIVPLSSEINDCGTVTETHQIVESTSEHNNSSILNATQNVTKLSEKYEYISQEKIVTLTDEFNSFHPNFDIHHNGPSKLILLNRSELSKTRDSPKKVSTFYEEVSKFQKMKLQLNSSLSSNMHSKYSETENLKEELVKKEEELKILKDEIAEKNKILNKLFNNDQRRMLKEGHHSGNKFSNETIQTSMKLKFACGTTGYEALIKEGFPFPSIRTLTRRIEHIKFEPGILYEVFDFLPEKVGSMKPEDTECNIVIDEVSIVEGVFYDPSTHKIIGYVTLPPGNSERAQKALVIMLSGLRARWKQVVAYFFTSPTFDGSLLKPTILEIIHLSWRVGLKIRNFISDMGPQNMQVWKSFGIKGGRTSKLINKIQHPCDDAAYLWFMPDSVHAFKNFRSALENNEVIILPETICCKYGLVSPVVCFKHLDEIIELEKNEVIKLAHDASKTKLHPNTFEKMKVKTSRNTINEDTAAALEFWANEKDKPEYITTAWFIRQVSRWYKLMNSNNGIYALSYRKPEKYNEAVEFLKTFIENTENMRIGNCWKPIQTAVNVATTTVLELSEYLLSKMNYDYVFTAHMNSNCIENIFSIVKSKHPTPNCLQFKQDLRNLTVSQFMKIIKTSSYDFESIDFLTSLFLKPSKQKEDIPNVTFQQEAPEKSSKYNVLQTTCVEYEGSTLNALYYMFGHILYKLKKGKNTCEVCLKKLVNRHPMKVHYTRYARLKEYKKNCLVYLNASAFRFFLELESLFLVSEPFFNTGVDTQEFLMWQFLHNNFVSNFKTESCHNIKTRILKKYASFRIKINNQKSKDVVSKALSQVPASTGSRSMAMRCYINRQSC